MEDVMKNYFFRNISTRNPETRVLRSRRLPLFAAALFILCSFPVRAQDIPPDTAKAFAEAGIPLLARKVPPQDFSLPLALSQTPLANAGQTQSLKQLKGKVVFLNFWATWCGPCREEMPSMETLYSRYSEKGLEILAVNCGEEQRDVLAFIKTNKFSFPALMDADGKVSNAYGIRAIPTTFIIDRDGNIIARVVGSINWNTPKIAAALDLLL